MSTLTAMKSIASTGDENPILIWLILAGVALLAIIAAIVLMLIKKKKPAKKTKAAEPETSADTDPVQSEEPKDLE